MEQATILVAFVAGMLSFLSPCVFPLLPAYVSHLTGAVIKGDKLETDRKVLLTRSLGFMIGFSIVFIAMGASASFIGRLFAEHRELAQKLSGLLIVIFGLQMAGLIQLKFLMRGRGRDASFGSAGMMRSVLTGLAFGTGWSPCVGLALSSILLLAGSSDTVWSGVVLLAVYSIGLGIPFLVISWALTYSTRIVRRMNRYIPILSILNGAIFIALGLLLYTGQLQKLSAWLSRYTLFDITF